MDISQILGGGGGGGMAGMAAMNSVGGLGGLGGMRMSGIPGAIPGGGPRGMTPMGGRGGMQEPIDPRIQNMTPEQLFDPNGRIAHWFGGTGAMNPGQAALVEQRMGQGGGAPGMNPNAMMGLMRGPQQPGGGSPLRGAFGRIF